MRPVRQRRPDPRPGSRFAAAAGMMFFLILLAAAAVAATAPPPLDPVVAAAIADAAHPARQADGRVAVWVFFAPRAADLRSAALDADASLLTPRALSRRARMQGGGRPLIDARDLPLDAACLHAGAATGATPRRQSRWLNAASYDATPEQVRALAALPCVRRVSLVGLRARPTPGSDATRPAVATGDADKDAAWTLDYGLSAIPLELIDVPPVHELGYTGAGVLVAMFDTGFHMAHESLAPLPVVAAWDFVGNDGNVDAEPGDPVGSVDHGTMVTSVMGGFAPGHVIGPAYGASVLLARAEEVGVTSPAEEDCWVAAIEWAEAQGADVVSSSLGYLTWYTREQLDGDTAPSSIAADRAAALGVLVVNAAGNQGGTDFDVVVAPADGDSVMAVGALEPTGLISLFSSSGPAGDGRTKPDVAAQGNVVTGADASDDHAYAVGGGTSLSAPQVAGVAALILERAPFLTPMQVREALRQTADRHDAPDNHYGWGTVDAAAAVFYWGPHLAHTPLADSEDVVGPYTVAATVTDPFGLDAAGPHLHWRANGGSWQDAAMANQGGDTFASAIPGAPAGTVIEYYLSAADVRGLAADLPLLAPHEVFSFTVAPDTTAPVIAHVPLERQLLSSWPPYLVAEVTDDIGVAAVTVSVAINGVAIGDPAPLYRGDGDTWSRAFPLDAAALADGDTIAYSLTARDVSLAGNEAVDGPHAFAVRAGAGRIVLVNDTGGGTEAATVTGWLTAVGYQVTTRYLTTLTDADLAAADALVVLSGSNSNPLASLGFRNRVMAWHAGGGRVLSEGGEVAYAAVTDGSIGVYAAQVVGVTFWRGDSAGQLVAAAGQGAHPLLTRPLAVSTPLTFSGNAEADQDAAVLAPGARLVLECTSTALTSGAHVFEGSAQDPRGRTATFCFALSALSDQEQARRLVVNAAAFLLDPGAPAGVDDGPDTPAAALLSLVAAPNPFNSRTVLRCDLAAPVAVSLEILDVRGRLVRRLLDGGGVLSAGPHDFPWDARDDAGRTVGSGLYFARLRAGDEVRTGKVVLVR